MNDIINEYDLFIFDLDETLVMTERDHNKAGNIAVTKELNKVIEFDLKNNDIFSYDDLVKFDGTLPQNIRFKIFNDISCIYMSMFTITFFR